MRRLAIVFLFVLSTMGWCAGQAATSGSQTDASNPDSSIKGAFPISLTRPLDSKKLKDGDVVICQTMGVLRSRSGLIIPTGSKVFGHITEAKARSKGDSESSLAMVFDKVEITKGKDLPMTGVLQAVGPSLGGHSGPDTGAAGPGNLPGHGDASTMPQGTSSGSGPDSGVHPLNMGGRSVPLLNSESMGVLGIKDLEMSKDSVITSSGKEVKLDTGTQLLVRAEIQVPGQ
jgi:hypothetical protein